MTQQGGLLHSLFGGGNQGQQSGQRAQAVQVQQVRQAPQVQQVRQAPQAQQVRQAPQARQVQQVRQAPQARQVQQVRQAPQARQVQQVRQAPQAQQVGGVRGDGYSSAHFLGPDATARGTALAAASQEWRDEVAAEVERLGPSSTGKQQYKQALINASAARKAADPTYQTTAEEHASKLKGFDPANVNCGTHRFKGMAAGACPAMYRKGWLAGVVPEKRSHRALTHAAASQVLRRYYRLRASEYKGGIKGANRAMALDMSKKKGIHPLHPERAHKPLVACPTKPIKVTYKKGTLIGRTITRNVIDPNADGYAACKRNWLYRGSGASSYDVDTLDYGQGRTRKIRAARK